MPTTTNKQTTVSADGTVKTTVVLTPVLEIITVLTRKDGSHYRVVSKGNGAPVLEEECPNCLNWADHLINIAGNDCCAVCKDLDYETARDVRAIRAELRVLEWAL